MPRTSILTEVGSSIGSYICFFIICRESFVGSCYVGRVDIPFILNDDSYVVQATAVNDI